MGKILDEYKDKYNKYVSDAFAQAEKEGLPGCQLMYSGMWMTQMFCHDNQCEPWEPGFGQLMIDLHDKDIEMFAVITKTINDFLVKPE